MEKGGSVKFLAYTLTIFLAASLYCENGSSTSLNEAVSFTLFNQKEIQISILNIKNQAGVLQASGGPFDLIINNRDDVTRTHDTSCDPFCKGFSTTAVTAESNAKKTTRLGTSFSVDAHYTRYSSQSASSEVTFLVDQPLLRNFYYGIDRQIEEANRLELEAVQWDTLFFISNKILDTVNRYWAAVAAKLSYEALQASVQRLEKVTEDIERLIEGNELAKNDKNQPLATLANIKQQTITAKYTEYSAKQLLLFAMGKIEEERSFHFEEKIQVFSNFPEVPMHNALVEAQDAFIQQAFVMRYDLLASFVRQTESEALVIGAENQALPDLNVFGSYTRHNAHVKAFQAPCTSPDFSNIPLFVCRDSEWRFGVNFSVPLYNDSALGFLKQKQAQFQQDVLKTQLLKQNIIVTLLDIVNLLISIEKEMVEAEQAVSLYNTLYENEVKKLAAGFGSVFELLDFETKRIDSLLSYISLKSSFFQNIANLRHETGTLIIVNAKDGTINFQDVTQLFLP